MPSGSQYGAVDSPPVPPAQATQATTQRLSSYSTKSKPSGPESVLPVVAPSSHSNNNALSNGNGNGHSNGLNGANGNGNGVNGNGGGKGMKVWLSRSIDSKQASLISVANCFLTGFTSAVAFSACYIWPGFQTGNVAQLAISVARLFDPPATRTYGFQKGDQQALVSLVCFWLGASLGRIGARLGPKSRRWILPATFAQVVLTIVAAVLVIPEPDYGSRPNPSWADARGMAALGCLSAGLGIQGIIGKRVGSEMNTTVVLTATWVEIFNEPGLFTFGFVKSRDARIAGVMMIFVGALIGRALLGAIGSGGTLGVLAGLRALSALGWAMVPAA